MRNDETGQLSQLSLDTLLKRLGNKEALASVARTGLPEKEVRLGPIDLIRAAYRVCQERGDLPNWSVFKPFRIGWRGNARLSNHGRASAYTMGCRCNECTEAWRLYSRNLRANRKAAFAAVATAAAVLA